MILIKAEQKSSRQSPRKVRLVADAIRGLSLSAAVAQLGVTDKKASTVVLKVVRQAVANATNNLGLPVEDLQIHEILVNAGPIYKRWRAVSRGRGHAIKKPTCHVKVVLKAKDSLITKATDKKVAKPAKLEKTVKSTKPDQAVAAPTAGAIQTGPVEIPSVMVQPKNDPRRIAKRMNQNQKAQAVRAVKKPVAAKTGSK